MKYGLIGEKLSHSYSKVIHGFLGNGDYELREFAPCAVEDFLHRADFSGINITIPYKETVMPYCVLDDDVKKIGSVNTIVNKNGTLYGYNTDYFGFLYLAEKADVSFAGKKIIVLGSGGTSKTVVRAAHDRNAKEVIVVSRNGENNYGNIARHADCDVLVNTTPVGMFPKSNAAPVSLDNFSNLSAVIDVIYNPLRSKLVLDAKARGIAATGGIAMLAAQAVKAHHLFFGVSCGEDAELRVTEEIAAKTETFFANIVLVGMPGCGKTTIGKELAARLERDFIDTDEFIETQIGRTIPAIIQTEGEPRFRELERGVIAEVSANAGAKAGSVIATGGGSVLSKENRETLLQNGVVFFMDRPLEKLATKGRPLSVNLDALYQERLPLYKSIAQHTIRLTDNLQDNVEKVVTLLFHRG